MSTENKVFTDNARPEDSVSLSDLKNDGNEAYYAQERDEETVASAITGRSVTKSVAKKEPDHQEEVEKTLQKMANGKEITVFGSGRTDAGVHAIGQVIHFDYPEERPLERMRFALDTQSPEDIAVRQVEIVSEDFHARYLVKDVSISSGYRETTQSFSTPLCKLFSLPS